MQLKNSFYFSFLLKNYIKKRTFTNNYCYTCNKGSDFFAKRIFIPFFPCNPPV